MTDTTSVLSPRRRSRSARWVLALLLTLAATALSVVATTPRSADAAPSGTGWVRLAHLSPDTPAVNVALTAFGNSKVMIKLSDVRYGDVSAYQKVPAGRYVASMTPAGSPGDGTPSVTQAVTVSPGKAYTVAAIGANADLKGTVLQDDLSTPKSGEAKVRLLQAAVSSPTATVTALGGPVLAKDAVFGSSTGYATIRSGLWKVEIAPSTGSTPTTVGLTAQPGSVNTILLLDGPGGVVTAKVVKDASASPKAPKKGTGVNTGGGGTATQFVDGVRR